MRSTIAASADDAVTRDAGLLTLGMGTHLDPEVAILRALTEVAQSRATQINGAREDTVRADFAREQELKLEGIDALVEKAVEETEMIAINWEE